MAIAAGPSGDRRGDEHSDVGAQVDCYIDGKERKYWMLPRQRLRKLHSNPRCSHVRNALDRADPVELEVCKDCCNSVYMVGVFISGRE